MTRPVASPGSRSFLAPSSAQRSSASAASATLDRNGAHSSDRPISSKTRPSSG